jgi:hypothetical protein
MPNEGSQEKSDAKTKVAQGDLQKTFIAMLFAFAVSVVAQQISELLTVATSNWRLALSPLQIFENVRTNLWPMLSVTTHSLLALLMLSVSWVMWSKSQAAGHLVDINEIFSIKFITFLMEVLLVTLYFSLSKSAEGDYTAYQKNKEMTEYLTEASARPEAMQMFWIFLIFAVWDYIVDVAQSPKDPQPSSAIGILGSHLSGISVYCSVSILCSIGALGVYFLSPAGNRPIEAVFGDIALVSLLLLFNRAKTWEHYIFRLFPSERSRNNTKRLPTAGGNYLILIILFIYTICALTMKVATLCTRQ